MYYNKDSQQKERERDILILIGMKVTIIAYLYIYVEGWWKKKWTGSQGRMSRLYSKDFCRPIKNYFQTI